MQFSLGSRWRRSFLFWQCGIKSIRACKARAQQNVVIDNNLRQGRNGADENGSTEALNGGFTEKQTDRGHLDAAAGAQRPRRGIAEPDCET